jgi:hypothetical protein
MAKGWVNLLVNLGDTQSLLDFDIMPQPYWGRFLTVSIDELRQSLRP